MLYFDASYLVRLYLEDDGFEKVRSLAAINQLACCLHGRAETIAAFHRKLRDGYFNPLEMRDVLRQFELDCAGEAFTWLPLSDNVVSRISKVYAALPKAVNLRAADAVHLACAAENHFREIHSNDQRFLEAAPHFGLQGRNII